jgi:hypothetical protein
VGFFPAVFLAIAGPAGSASEGRLFRGASFTVPALVVDRGALDFSVFSEGVRDLGDFLAIK